jgi:hypothetical protein
MECPVEDRNWQWCTYMGRLKSPILVRRERVRNVPMHEICRVASGRTIVRRERDVGSELGVHLVHSNEGDSKLYPEIK